MELKLKLAIGDVITNEEIREKFKCSLQGAMRKAPRTNTMVLVIDHTLKPNEYKWEDDVLVFAGASRKKDQKISAQTKTLAESYMNGVGIYLFEVYETKEYTFKGKVMLAGRPFKKEQEEGSDEEQWMFPLKVVVEEIDEEIAE